MSLSAALAAARPVTVLQRLQIVTINIVRNAETIVQCEKSRNEAESVLLSVETSSCCFASVLLLLIAPLAVVGCHWLPASTVAAVHGIVRE